MNDVFSMIQSIAPDMSASLKRRYQILFHLRQIQLPLGRKALAEKVDLSERSLRTIIDLMKEQNLVTVNRTGIQLTQHGQEVTDWFANNLSHLRRLEPLEEQLKKKLGINYCLVVPGDLDKKPSVYRSLSIATQQIMNHRLRSGKCIIAVTGGETLAHIGEEFTDELSLNRELIFVPARGGVGGGFNIQSNMVGGVMAQKTRAQYIPLFIPDSMQETASEVLLSDPSISHAIALSKEADCLLVSVGSAETMAQRRDLTDDQLKTLKEKKAIGEVFGVFYTEDGQEVLKLPRVGIQFEDIQHIPLVITVVGGASKAQAVKGYCQLTQHHGWLICDEGVANMILNEETHEK